MLKCKNLLDCTSLLAPKESEKNDEIILKYFQSLKTKNFCLYIDSKKVAMKKYIVLSKINIQNLKSLKYT